METSLFGPTDQLLNKAKPQNSLAKTSSQITK